MMCTITPLLVPQPCHAILKGTPPNAAAAWVSVNKQRRCRVKPSLWWYCGISGRKRLMFSQFYPCQGGLSLGLIIVRIVPALLFFHL